MSFTRLHRSIFCSRIIHRQLSTQPPHPNQSPLDLSHLNCLITGGSRGIGLAIAERLVTHGASCTILSRNKERSLAAIQRLEETAQRHSHAPKVAHCSADVGDSNFWQAASRGEPFDFANVDVLVNAAGVSQNQLLMRTAADEVHHIIQTNLTGAILACKAAQKAWWRTRTRHLKGHGRCIINVSSLLALQGGSGAAIYAASKAGLLGFTRALVAEFDNTGVRVNAIVPGYVETEMTAELGEGTLDVLRSQIPARRLGTTEEVADAAVFLATNQYANNCVLNLDGGLSAMGMKSRK